MIFCKAGSPEYLKDILQSASDQFAEFCAANISLDEARKCGVDESVLPRAYNATRPMHDLST